MYIKDYVILHGEKASDVFGGWVPFKLTEWHAHPLGPTDSIVTLYLTTQHVRDDLEAMEAAGRITILPYMTSGANVPDAVLNHATCQAAGVVQGDRTYDVAAKLHKHLGWPPLNPNR